MVKCRCGEEMKFLGNEDDGTPIFYCSGCREHFLGATKHEQRIAVAKLLRE